MNGPGEAGDADFGIAGGRDVGFVYAHGRVLKKVAVRRPRRRVVLGDRRLDRGRDAAAEAAKDGQACCARDGRSLADSSEVTSPDEGLSSVSADAARRPCRRRGGQPQATRARRVHRQVSAGLWTFLPLGWRVHRKIEQIIREEMDAIGGQEMLMPLLTPAELWETTGRIAIPEVFHIEDRTAGTSCSP